MDLYDTTLRDGAQTEGVNFSIDDKNKIAKALSNLGVDYLEGGWPGANTLDTTFFNNPPKLENTILTAFGMTKKTGRSAENDPGLSSLLNTKASAICLVGKTWDFHVDVALGITKEENLENIKESAKLFVKNKKEFMFDAEHFFDGYKKNPEYALNCVQTAYDEGARWIVLCDTNGGTLPHEVGEIVLKVSKKIPGKNLGILSTKEALHIAKEEGLDLIEISPNAKPPVCKIIDIGKYKYDLQKKASKAKKKQKISELKEIKLRPNTEIHDYNFKIKNAQRFLSKKEIPEIA